MVQPTDSGTDARRRTLPAGGATEWLVMADGWTLRTLRWADRAVSGRGSIFLITGRGDFLEKFAEILHDLVDAGWGVAIFDWRGQGLSGRLGRTPQHGHVDDFGVLQADMAEVFDWFHGVMPGPYFAVAHSMGGHFLLKHLALHPEAVVRGVLLSPMLGIAAPPLGQRLAGWLARLMVAAGRGGEWVFGAGPHGTGGGARRAMLTSDPARYADEFWWTAQAPALAIGGITWGWLAAAVRSMAGLRRPATPLLVLMAAREALVANAATRRLFPEAEIVAGASHELVRETDAIRNRVMDRIERYLGAA